MKAQQTNGLLAVLEVLVALRKVNAADWKWSCLFPEINGKHLLHCQLFFQHTVSLSLHSDWAGAFNCLAVIAAGEQNSTLHACAFAWRHAPKTSAGFPEAQEVSIFILSVPPGDCKGRRATRKGQGWGCRSSPSWTNTLVELLVISFANIFFIPPHHYTHTYKIAWSRDP